MKKFNSYLVVDEAFIEFAPDESVISFVEQFDNLMVLRSLTKYFGLAGLRCGYIAAHPNRIDELNAFIPPWSINSLAQTAGAWVLNNPNHFHNTKENWLHQAKMLQNCFYKYSCLKLYPSVTGYFLIQFHQHKNARLFQEKLAQKRIMVRNCSNYVGLDETYVRIGARDDNSNAYLMKILQSTELKEAFE